MKKLALSKSCLLGATIAAAALVAGCNKPAEKAAKEEATAPAAPAAAAAPALTTDEQKVTYIVGYRMASQAKAGGFQLDKNVIGMAIQDVLDGKDPQIAQDEQRKIMMAFQQKQEAKRQEKRKVESDENKTKGEAFLAENAKREGVTTTESGLQYEILKPVEGDAAKPAKGDKVKVHYHGTLIDGTVFDSSVDRGRPVTFPVTGVIAGWVEALQLMKVGEKYKLAIPAALAYGESGTGSIGPNSALIFEVELIEINPEPEQKAGGHGHSHDDGKPHNHP
jgi:FKBP-type peptidyl-prolyl cis-trans isomerase